MSPHNADAYSLKTFSQFYRWRDLQGDAKVFEIFKYLADRRTGLYPLGVPAREGREDLPEYDVVTDPVKMLNVYPIGHCGTLGPTAAGILEGLGIGPGRTLIIPGWNHVAAEVFYDDRWHYFDLDVRAVFRRGDGSLASMEEARTDTSLWGKPNSPLFFPLDELDSVRRAYAKTPAEPRYGVASGGHTMDFVLRHGETFTRWWKPQGGRWNHHPSYAAKPFPRNVIDREPRGPKSKHESFTIHTHGNGRFVYRPNLTAKSSDFDDGVYDAQNAQPGPSGLTLKSAGEGYAIFEVRTPYVIVPLVGELDNSKDDREASVVKLAAVGATLALSVDNGLTWQRVIVENGTVDLTPQVSGRYGYLLRIQLRGEPEKTMVRSLEIITWVQLHPASLPSLRQGKNTMRLVTDDHYGLPTRVVAVCPSAGDRKDFLKHLLEPPADYDPARRTSRVRGSFVAKVQPPPGTKIAWFSAGASFTASVGATQNTRNAIAYAINEPTSFREIYRANIPSDQSHWHYNVDREVKLDEPARTLFVRYVGEPAVNNIRIFAHCLEDRPRPSAPVILTHEWSENGVRKSKQVRLEGPGEFDIEAGADPVDESIEITVPSVARAAEPHRQEASARPSQRGTSQTPAQSWFPKAPSLPRPQGEVIPVATVAELFTAVAQVKPGGTILIADGHYWMPRCLRLRTDRVTLRGESGERERVTLDGTRSQDGELLALHACSGVTIADLTIQNIRHNGIKINSDSNVQRVMIHNCILHNLWQRGVKGVKVPPEQREATRPRDCRVQYCLFYNDRPKSFADDPADTPQNFDGNYVGGIDVMYAKGWIISDNVFIGIQGRTRGARGAVFLWHEVEDCVVERNIIIDCDTGIALGNSHKPAEVPVHATRCIVRNNFITRAPESGIVADYTRDSQIVHNTIHDPTNRLGRLIRLVHDNDGLLVANNLLSGPTIRNESSSRVTFRQNVARDMTDSFAGAAAGNLHLNAPVPEVVDQVPVDGVLEDIDSQPRSQRPDIGADEVEEVRHRDAVPSPPSSTSTASGSSHVTAGSSPRSGANDWPQWRGPNQNGSWEETGILESFPAGGLTVRWRFPIGWGFSSPVVAQGRVYVIDAELQQPKFREHVYCLEAETGKLLWKWAYDAAHPDWIFMAGQERGPAATPIVRDGKVYTLGIFGDIFCLDSAKGNVIWTRSLSKVYQLNQFPTDASPLIEGELLVLFIGGKPGASVIALDKSTGKDVWKALDDSPTHSSPIVAAAGGTRQIIVWTQQAVTSLNPTNGQTYWREPLQTSADAAVATPVFHKNRLLISGLMLRLDSDRPAASVLWPQPPALSRRILSNTSTPLFQGEHIYSAKSSGELVCLEASSGQQLWETNKVTDLISGASLHLTANGDGVFLFTDKGELIRAQLTPEGYKEVSRAALVEPTWPFAGRKVAWAAPAFANRCVCVRNDKELICASLAAAVSTPRH